MNYAAILFDMDGTLIESGPVWDKATRTALQSHNVVLSEEDLQSLGGILLHDLLHNKGFDADAIASIRAARDNAMQSLIPMHVQWITEAPEMLASIRVATGIITSTHERVFQHLDAALNIRATVDTVVLADDVRPEYKPHPKGLLIACERLNVDPVHCVYIGDQLCDLEAAKNAGMDSILIRGSQTPVELAHGKVANNFVEITELLRID
jgi:N-acetyl-D-muramate 6-phosphate phosphatase